MGLVPSPKGEGAHPRPCFQSIRSPIRHVRKSPASRLTFVDIIAVLLSIFAVYLTCGFLFAIPFVLLGAGRIDPHAAHGSWGFRMLILPGTVFLWPLLARRWWEGVQEPPEEDNPHRLAARSAIRLQKSNSA